MVMNMKGGVGKTTLSTYLAWGLAWHYDARVLLIDYDPQCSASLVFLQPQRYFELKDADKTLGGILTPSVQPKDPFTKLTLPAKPTLIDLSSFTSKVRQYHYAPDNREAGCVHLIPGDLDLIRIALASLPKDGEARLLARWNDLIALGTKHYDVVIIDCHPAGSFFTKSSILSSDYILIPVTTDRYAALGLNLMRSFIESWAAQGGAQKYGIVFNSPRPHHNQGIETSIRTNARFSGRCFAASLHYTSLVGGVSHAGKLGTELKRPYRRRLMSAVAAITHEFIGTLISDKLVRQESWKSRR